MKNKYGEPIQIGATYEYRGISVGRHGQPVKISASRDGYPDRLIYVEFLDGSGWDLYPIKLGHMLCPAIPPVYLDLNLCTI